MRVFNYTAALQGLRTARNVAMTTVFAKPFTCSNLLPTGNGNPISPEG
jgi:hypothetical protein